MAVAAVFSQTDIQTTGSYQSIYTVTASKIFNGQLRLVSQNASGATVTVALKSGASPTDAANMFFYDVMTQWDWVDLTNITLPAAAIIYVETDTADVTATVTGLEEDV